MEALDVKTLVVPAIVIDIRARAKADPDATLTVADIRAMRPSDSPTRGWPSTMPRSSNKSTNQGAAARERGRRGGSATSATGCLWVESTATCPQEYDLVLVKENSLFLGERPAQGKNICEPSSRPSRLRTTPLIKK